MSNIIFGTIFGIALLGLFSFLIIGIRRDLKITQRRKDNALLLKEYAKEQKGVFDIIQLEKRAKKIEYLYDKQPLFSHDRTDAKALYYFIQGKIQGVERRKQ